MRRISASGCIAAALLSVALLTAAPATASAGGAAKRIDCLFPAAGKQWLPAACLRGPLQFLREYPEMRLVSPTQRGFARRLHDGLVAAAKDQNWRDLRAAAELGYNTHPAPRRPGDLLVHYFHAGRAPEPRRHGLLDVRRPKTLIYANAPGRPLVLVGAMWTTHAGERGPTPGGQLTRWHSHFSCGDEHSMAGGVSMKGLTPNDLHSVMKLSEHSGCPPGMQLHLGRIEMMHVWFTHDLRSAFGARPPEHELCKAAFIPARYC